jgi:AcrR family transcriptional regulator
VPRLWSETIEAHRREVKDAILDATAALVTERGVLSVTMSEIAEATGIGRATLYKYFSDVEAILLSWHERQVVAHVAQLIDARDRAGDAAEQLEAVLEAYALIQHEHHGSQMAALLDQGGHAARMHGSGHVARAHHHLTGFLADLLAEGAKTGAVRADIASDELAGYCLAALAGAGSLPSKRAVRRLVGVTLAGLRPPN